MHPSKRTTIKYTDICILGDDIKFMVIYSFMGNLVILSNVNLNANCNKNTSPFNIALFATYLQPDSYVPIRDW